MAGSSKVGVECLRLRLSLREPLGRTSRLKSSRGVRVSTPSARGASSASRIARTSGLRALSDRTVVVLRERIRVQIPPFSTRSLSRCGNPYISISLQCLIITMVCRFFKTKCTYRVLFSSGAEEKNHRPLGDVRRPPPTRTRPLATGADPVGRTRLARGATSGLEGDVVGWTPRAERETKCRTVGIGQTDARRQS